MKKKLLPIAALALLLILMVGVLSAGATDNAAVDDDFLTNLEAEAEASGDPLQTSKDRLKELQDRQQELENEVAEKDTLIKGHEHEIASIEAQMLIIQEQLSLIQVGIDDANEQVLAANVAIAEAEARLDEQRDYLNERIYNLYVYGEISFADVIFATESFEDFLILFDMVEMMVEQDQELINIISRELAIINDNKALAEKMVEELTELTYEHEDALAAQQRLEGEKVAAMQLVMADREQVVAMLEAEAAAAEQVGDMLRDYLATHGDYLSYGGSMIWPLPSQWGRDWITSPYGWRTHPITNDQRLHTGIDIAADGGTPIYAVADGEIISRGWIGGYGNTVQILHGDGVSTLYAHQSAFGAYGEGDMVVTGDIIGYVGTTGNSTGNHLHFEVRVNGNHTDPMAYL